MLNEIDVSRVDLNLLVLFEAVLEEKHVARAAQRLHLSASAVSHGIRRLRQTFNDPLFLKHPKGVVPTARALAMAPDIAQILAHVRQVVASAEAFDPARSQRRLVIGAPDALALVTLPPVLEEIEKTAPGMCIGVQNLQPAETLGALDARQIDVALYPLDELPPRFEGRELFKEEFVVAARAGHRLMKRLTLEGYCKARHVLVSTTSDPRGFVDDVLEQLGHSRKVALTVPTFMLALAVIATSDMIGTLPRSIVDLHAKRLNVLSRNTPFPLSVSTIRAVSPKAAMQDRAVSWLMDMLQRHGIKARTGKR
ncbi:MAG: LysR family transcriptional regulator [Steroidobacteraceae bacterium]